MGSWAQSKLPLLMLPGKWWHELRQWKSSSEAGRQSLSCAGGWAGTYSLGHFLSTITSFYWKNISSSHIWKYLLVTEVIILLLYPSINCENRKLILLFFLLVCLFTYFKGGKNRIYYKDKESTLITFFTRGFPEDMNFINLSNTLCLVWWWGNQ